VCDESRVPASGADVNLLDRYIFKSVFVTCAGAIALFVFIMVVPNVARELLPRVTAGQLSPTALAHFIVLLLPHAITYALPMGMLTGVLLTLGRLSADSEITAMRASGVGLGRIAVPIVLLASAAVGLALYFNFDSMPRARVQYYKQLAAAVRANPLSFIVPKTFIRDFPGYVVYVHEKEGALLQDFWLWQLDENKEAVRVVHAVSGQIDYDESDNSFVLRLFDAKVESRTDRDPEDFSEAPLVGSFEQSDPIRLSLDRFFGPAGTARMKDNWLTYSELKLKRSELVATPVPQDEVAAADLRQRLLKLDLIISDKFNLSLAVLSLACIGVPLGLKVSRRETSANLGVALVLAMGFYLATTAVKVLDRHPELRPDLLLWLPNLLLLGGAIWLLEKISRR